MRRASIDNGFLLCWGLNLFLNWEGGAFAIILWVAAEWFGLSIYPAIAVALLWILGTFFLTAILSWASRDPKALKQNSDLPNANPYSPKTKGAVKK